MDEKDIEKEIRNAWEEEPDKQPLESKEASWDAFSAQAFPAQKKGLKPWVYAAAAVLVISLTIGAVITFNAATPEGAGLSYNIVENPTSKIKAVCLPDSSIVELEPNSRIEYKNDFEGNRKINLKGKAFFKVRKDKKHPFRVFCGETTTTVLGTSFTIAGDTENRVSVHLYEGSVQMNVKDNTNNWILSPGEQFIYDKKSVKVEAFNRFVDFNNVELTSVIRYVKENYGCQIEMPEEYLRKPITLRLNRKEELSNIITIISQMYNLTPAVNEEIKKVTFQ
ncbi:FecR family protein [Flavobacterium hauense]